MAAPYSFRIEITSNLKVRMDRVATDVEGFATKDLLMFTGNRE